MALVKPTRRDILKIAAENAVERLEEEAQAARVQAEEHQRAYNNIIYAKKHQTEEKAKKKIEPLVKEITKLCEKHGHKVNPMVHCQAGNNKQVVLNMNVYVQADSGYKYPQNVNETKEAKEALEKKNECLNRANILDNKARSITSKTIMSAAIAKNLNGKAEEAMDVLVESLKDLIIDV